MSHTPGPWKLLPGRNHLYTDDTIGPGDYRKAAQNCLYVFGPAHDSDFVADLILDVGPVGDANADVLVASLALLEACEAMLEDMRTMGMDTEGYDESMNLARAALESARPK